MKKGKWPIAFLPVLFTGLVGVIGLVLVDEEHRPLLRALTAVLVLIHAAQAVKTQLKEDHLAKIRQEELDALFDRLVPFSEPPSPLLPFYRFMRTQIIFEAGKALTRLGNGGSLNVGQVLAALDANIRLPGLKTVHAVCGKKDWNDDKVTAYMEANRQLADSGVTIERVFIEPVGGSFCEAEIAIIEEHLGTANMEASVLFKDKSSAIGDIGLPEGFGFVIFTFVGERGPPTKKAIIHWGLDRKALIDEAGKEVRDGLVIEVLERIHAMLQSRGTSKPEEILEGIKDGALLDKTLWPHTPQATPGMAAPPKAPSRPPTPGE